MTDDDCISPYKLNPMTAPKYKDGKAIHVIQAFIPNKGNRWFVDYVRNAKRHTCTFQEYELVEHLRCPKCGQCVLRSNVPGATQP